MPEKAVALRSHWEGGSYYILNQYRNWRNSPKDSRGNLILQSNPYEGFTFWVDDIGGNPYIDHWGQEYWPFTPPDAGSNPVMPGLSFTSTDNVAYAKWRGKLHKGSASMGVTLASWKQSRQMITGRLNHARRTVDSAYHGLLGNQNALRRLKKEREPLASQVLETEFGWRPLFEDVTAALTTVCQADLPSGWIASRHKEPFSKTIVDKDPWHGNMMRETYTGWKMTSYGAKVSVSNPNTWLLNRLGLINPATIVWDLVPWSFLVNQFVNVNALLNSVTDTVGLNVTDHSITRTWESHRSHEKRNPDLYPGHVVRSKTGGRYKGRVVGVPLKPVLEMKVPKLDWESALIASSLLVQRASRLSKLIRVL